MSKRLSEAVDLDDSTELVAGRFVKMQIVDKLNSIPDNLKKEYVLGDDTEVSTGLWKQQCGHLQTKLYQGG